MSGTCNTCNIIPPNTDDSVMYFTAVYGTVNPSEYTTTFVLGTHTYAQHVATGYSVQASQWFPISFTAGDGINDTQLDSFGNIQVNVDDSTIEIATDALQLKDDGVTGAKLAPAVAGSGLVQDISGNLDINVDNVTLEVASDVLQVKDGGIDTDQLANGAVTSAKLDAGAVQTPLTASWGINATQLASDLLEVQIDSLGGANIATVMSLTSNGVAIKIDDTTIGENGSNRLEVKDDGITNAKLAGATVGNLITYNVAGDPGYLTTGTAGQVLTSNGAGAIITWEDPVAGTSTAWLNEGTTPAAFTLTSDAAGEGVATNTNFALKKVQLSSSMALVQLSGKFTWTIGSSPSAPLTPVTQLTIAADYRPDKAVVLIYSDSSSNLSVTIDTDGTMDIAQLAGGNITYWFNITYTTTV